MSLKLKLTKESMPSTNGYVTGHVNRHKSHNSDMQLLGFTTVQIQREKQMRDHRRKRWRAPKDERAGHSCSSTISTLEEIKTLIIMISKLLQRALFRRVAQPF